MPLSKLAIEQLVFGQLTVLIAQKKWQDAEGLLQRAIAIDPTRPALWENLNRALVGQNRLAEAERARLKVIALTQPSPSGSTTGSVSQQDTDDLVSRCLTHGGQLSLSADDV